MLWDLFLYMKKIIGLIILILIFSFSPVYAQEAGSSASLASNSSSVSRSTTKEILLKKKVIKTVLSRYHSPLVSEVDAFVDSCIKYEIDCYWVVSIAGVESTFGKAIMPGTYNGWGWGGGTIYFKDWSDGIDIVSKGLKTRYIDQGADTIEKIAHIYAPPSTTWASHVYYFMNQFQAQEQNIKSLTIDL
jgi:hypothetical protein